MKTTSILFIPKDLSVHDDGPHTGRLPSALDDVPTAVMLAHDGQPIRLSVLWLHDIVFPGQVCTRFNEKSKKLTMIVHLVENAERQGLGLAVFLDADGREIER